MNYETADDVLEHFGVSGMKWGVRRSIKGRDLMGKRGVAIKLALGAGAVAAGVLLRRLGDRPVTGLGVGSQATFSYRINDKPWIVTTPMASLRKASNGS